MAYGLWFTGSFNNQVWVSRPVHRSKFSLTSFSSREPCPCVQATCQVSLVGKLACQLFNKSNERKLGVCVCVHMQASLNTKLGKRNLSRITCPCVWDFMLSRYWNGRPQVSPGFIYFVLKIYFKNGTHQNNGAIKYPPYYSHGQPLTEALWMLIQSVLW